MTAASNWDALGAIARIPQASWKGRAWRMHFRTYAATDPGGSRRVSGRYHRATDQFSAGRVWPVLYFALAPEVCLGEILRHLTADDLLRLNDYRLTELDVDLMAVLDCRDATAIGLRARDLIQDRDFSATQELAAAAVAREAEGILVPSATGLGDNLVIFSDGLRDSSRLNVVGSRDLRLYIPR